MLLGWWALGARHFLNACEEASASEVTWSSAIPMKGTNARESYLFNPVVSALIPFVQRCCYLGEKLYAASFS